VSNPADLTSTQRGKIAELHVATALMAQSAGRLSPFEPLSDDHGIDLVVLDKLTGVSLPIQVKSWFLSSDKVTKTVQFDVQKTTFSDGKPGALICVVIDPETMGIDTCWLIPTRKIPLVATNRPAKYAITPSVIDASKDKYVPYRHKSIKSLTVAVSKLLNDT
jgi:hypothetical protein